VRTCCIFTHTKNPLRPVDVVTIFYLMVINILIIIFRENLPQYQWFLAVHFLIIGLIVLITVVRWCSQSKLLKFIHYWYPYVLFGLFFEEIHYTVFMIFPGWFDHIPIKIDYALFGVHPTVWLEQFSNVWLNDYLQFAYTFYLILLPVLGGALYRRGDWQGFDRLMLSAAITYYLCYIIFILFPIEGPYHTLQHLQRVELEGWIFTDLINFIEKHGRVHGGALPSTHVAASLVVLICAYKYHRKIYYAILPIVLSLFVATVYGRYHYVTDVITGLGMGWIGCWLGHKLYSFWERRIGQFEISDGKSQIDRQLISRSRFGHTSSEASAGD